MIDVFAYRRLLCTLYYPFSGIDGFMIIRSEDWLRTDEERRFQGRVWKEIVAELGGMIPEFWGDAVT